MEKYRKLKKKFNRDTTKDSEKKMEFTRRFILFSIVLYYDYNNDIKNK